MQKTIHTARGVRLAVHETGPVDGPAVVLVHGWAQSGTAWAAVDGFRTYAVDLRGHGDSDEPADGYDDPTAWADDLAAVLAHVGRPAVLVGWSYGGLVVADYLRVHGTSLVDGIVLVGALIGMDSARVARALRSPVPTSLDDDAALAAFCAAMAPSLPQETIDRLTAAALRVSPAVRVALLDRDVDNTDVLAAVDVPAVVLHGLDDAVVAPSVAERGASAIPGADLVLLPDTGHLPFLERPAEFAAALATVVRRAEEAR